MVKSHDENQRTSFKRPILTFLLFKKNVVTAQKYKKQEISLRQKKKSIKTIKKTPSRVIRTFKIRKT